MEVNEEIEKSSRNLIVSYKMYEDAIKDTIDNMKEKYNKDGSRIYSDKDIEARVKIEREMQKDISDKYTLLTGRDVRNDLDKVELKKTDMEEYVLKEQQAKEEGKTVKEMDTTDYNDFFASKKEEKETDISFMFPSQEASKGYGTEAYDVIPLPSNGECYPNGIKSLPVSYLTANDENMIVSPNLYENNLITDYLLKAKIRNPSINPDDLVQGDCDAILLWLRASGYGPNYPVSVTDQTTGKAFSTVINLFNIKSKEFTLKGDEDGYFDFTVPSNKDLIKFKFLTRGDIKRLSKIDDRENGLIKKAKLERMADSIEEYLEDDSCLGKSGKLKMAEAKKNLRKWSEAIEGKGISVSHNLTNRMKMSIMSVNGNRDREFISRYVDGMIARDALEFRAYVTKNEPGMDFNLTVERPESLGGGSINIAVPFNEFIFLNVI